jgi:pyruvate decarboxylase
VVSCPIAHDELRSFISGIAGSMAERLPVLHLVGAPSSQMQVSPHLNDKARADHPQSSHSLLHHTLNTPGTFTTFSTMSEPLSCSQALLSSIPNDTPTTWTRAFDKVLVDVLEQCRPGYVEIPMDAVHAKVSSEGLKTLPVSYV